MREVSLSARLDRYTADEAYALVSGFNAYPDHSDAIISVSVDPMEEGTLYAVTWRVRFRDGVLCWSENDRLDPVARTIVFNQTRGDVKTFSGTWRIAQETGTVRVFFTATFDLGIPAFNEFLEPVAEQILIENIESILKGFFGDAIEIGPTTH